jgi:hypothetical protein
MSEIVVYGRTLTGRLIGDKGVFTFGDGHEYRGRVRAGKADSLGVLTLSNGDTWSGQWSAGERHGPFVRHWTDGDVDFCDFDHGNQVHLARVKADSSCEYDDQRCAADDARLVALQVAALPFAVRGTTDLATGRGFAYSGI